MSTDNARPEPEHHVSPDAEPSDENEFRGESLEGDEFTSDIDAGEAEADAASGTSDDS
ncbi:MAG: hypothetical protein ACQEW8_11905 [Actinomycetota bacterium]